MKQKRLIYLDILRCIACLSVVMIHASAGFATSEVGTMNYYVGTCWDSLARIGVPLFVMVSGALFLDEDYDCTTEKIEKHIKKMVLFFLFWSPVYAIAYNVVLPWFIDEQINVVSVVSSIINGHVHLWFVPMIVGLYLIVPLLRLWVKRSNIEYVKYYLLLSFLFAFVIPQVTDIVSVFDDRVKVITLFQGLNIQYVVSYVSYFILGWYLNNSDIKCNGTCYFLGIAGALTTVVGSSLLSLYKNEVILLLYDNFSCNVLLYAIMVFCVVKSYFSNHVVQDNIYKFINYLGYHSLGIYAMHSALISLFSFMVKKYISYSAFVAIPIIFLLTLLCSLIGTIVMKKLPGLRKVV